MFIIVIMMQEENTYSVDDGAENDEEETTVPFLVEEKPWCAVNSVKDGSVFFERGVKLIIC